MFTIYSTEHAIKTVVANVEDMAAVERFLAKLGTIIVFELDAAYEGCADAAVLVSPLYLRVYAIEEVR